MSILKSFIRLFPGGKSLAERNSYARRKRKLERIGSPEARFTDIFEGNKWKDAESRSGAGSSLDATKVIRKELPPLIEEIQAKTIFDAPCGDYNWFRHIDRGADVQYIGGDIVKTLVQSNTAAYADNATEFLHIDITSDTIPNADVWLCRDYLIHLSYEDIQHVIDNYFRSTIRYWLLTSHINVDKNIDIPTGHCRMLNLELEPLNFPAPIRYLDEDDNEGTGKRLGLWDRESLKRSLWP